MGEETAPFARSLATAPILAGNKIMVSLRNGSIQFYDPNNGKLLTQFESKAELFSQAVVNNGWIYTGTRGGKLISIDTKNRSNTGWGMWGGKANHNPVVK